VHSEKTCPTKRRKSADFSAGSPGPEKKEEFERDTSENMPKEASAFLKKTDDKWLSL
jgi:hypothetical protein